VTVSNMLRRATALACLSALAAEPAFAADVLICHASSWFQDVDDRLTATGLFDTVDSFDCSLATPTPATLDGYDAVLVFSDFGFTSPTLLGDRLADYVDRGGGVVEAVFANGSVPLSGRFESGGYEPITGSFQNQGIVLTLVPIDATHPLLEGVATFNGGPNSYHTSNAALGVGATLVAEWNNGLPLIAALELTEGRTVGLNFHPPSPGGFFGGWDPTTDGDLIMANALLWAGIPDLDGDGLTGDDDNCPEAANPGQEDADTDGAGDACDPCDDRFDPDTDGDQTCNSADLCPGEDDRDDVDGDGHPAACDLCPTLSDPAQTDADSDGVGDVCDVCPTRLDPYDLDGDLVCDGVDLCLGFDDRVDPDTDGVPTGCDDCPADTDPLQTDVDGDGTGDACDICPLPSDPADTDGDGVCDGVDACPDEDDRIDPDSDGVPTACDLCPFAADPAQADADGDTLGDACDVCPTPADPNDTDGDGVCDGVDACPAFDDGFDADRDGAPDDCDPCPVDAADDSDADGTCDVDDRCPGADDNGPDEDGDGFADACDNCDEVFNEDQRDFDGDGFGDVCDCRVGYPDEFPGSEEVCDFEDNDCDGLVDEDDAVDALEFWADADGDGSGNPAAPLRLCRPQPHAVQNARDCDDSTALAHPGGVEVCDGVDNDCDGEADPIDLCPKPPPAPKGVDGCEHGSGGAPWAAAAAALLLSRRRRR
jgi:hypothetical protein